MKAFRILQCSLGVAALMGGGALADVPAVYPVPQQSKLSDKTVHVAKDYELHIDIRDKQKGDTALLKGVPKKSGAYKLVIDASGKVSIGAHDARGAFYAKQTLRQLLSPAKGHGMMLPVGEIIDWPDIEYRGTVEGFYGTPWSHECRLEQLKFYGRNKMNTYIYGPKDDPYHSSPHWREPYPAAEEAQIKELVKVAKENHVDFVWAIHPGKDIKWTEQDMGNVIKKFEMMYKLGVRSFAVFFDDIFGEGTRADKQALLMNKINDEFVKKKGDVTPLVMCPTQYNRGWSHGDYLDVLGDKLDRSINVMWTGNTVCHDITLEGQKWVNKRLKRPSYVWLNFPVTDYCRANLCMGRAYGNATEPEAKEEMSGFVSNPMDKPEASKIPLFGIADYTWNIGAYDSDKSWKEGVKRIFPQAPEAMQVFVDHNSDQGPNGHGYRKEESVRIQPTVDSFMKSLRVQDNWTKLEGSSTLYLEFESMQKSANVIREKANNPRLMQEIGAWVDAFEQLGIAGQRVMEAMNLKGTTGHDGAHYKASKLVEATQALAAMDSISRSHNKEGVMYRSAVHTGSRVMTPAVNEMVETVGKKLMPELAGALALNPKPIVKGGNADGAVKFMDGDRGSFWHSGAYCNAGDYYGIDYGQPIPLRSVEILMGRNDKDGDYVLKGQLEVSRDMKTWKPLGPETGGRQVVWQGKKPVQARAIRYRVIEPNRINNGNTVWTALREFAVNTPLPAMASTSVAGLKGAAVQTGDKLVRIARVMETHKMKPGDHIALQLEAPTDATWLEVNLERDDLPSWAEVTLDVEGSDSPVVQRLEKYNGKAYVVKGDRLPKGIKGMKLVNKSNKEQDIVLTMFKFDVPPSDPGKNLGSLSDKNLKTVYRADSAFTAEVDNLDCPRANQVIVVGSAAAAVSANVNGKWVEAGKVPALPGAHAVKIPAGTKAVRLSGAAQPGKIVNEVIFKVVK